MASTLINNRYRVKQLIGKGGFGQTYLAIDTHLPSRPFLVLKEMRPVSQEPKTKELVRQRFKREAVVLEKLGKSHPQIPSLYAFFSESERFFLVQEWIEGQTLTEKLKAEGKLKEEEVKTILIEVLDILEYIHGKGIIHRDIKPDNIIIRKKDQKPVLIDFGAVKEVMGIHFNSHGSLNSSVRIGTPGFIAPEQAIGRPIHSSDLYSLALTAIYLISGKLPQEFPTNQVTSDIEWQPHCPTLSPWFESVLSKVTQNNPPNRYASAKEMKNALKSKSTVTFSNNFSTQSQTNYGQQTTTQSQSLTQAQQNTEVQSSSNKQSRK